MNQEYTSKLRCCQYLSNAYQFQRIQKERPAWFNYVLCAIKGIAEEGGMEGPLTGLDMMVSGNIPPSSGLSSSSALVCAAALAVSHAHDLLLSKETLAEICASCERHVGTQGGGMDQAISFLGTSGLYISLCSLVIVVF